MEDKEKQLTATEETEAIKALKEAYDEQLTELRQELADIKVEHAKQIKEILKSGTLNEAPVEETEKEGNPEDEMCDRILARIRKQRG